MRIDDVWEWGLEAAAIVADVECEAITKDAGVAKLSALRRGNPPRVPPGRLPGGEPVKVSTAIRERAKVLAKLYARMAGEEHRVQSVREEIGVPPAPDHLDKWTDELRCEAWEVDGCEALPAAEQAALRTGRRARPFPGPGGSFPVPDDSWAAYIAETVDQLTSDFPWRGERALAWLVCGQPVPPVVNATVSHRTDGRSPFDVGIDYRVGSRPATADERRRAIEASRDPTDTRWRITLTVDPAIGPAEVARLYGVSRAAIAPGRQRVRLPATRQLALASFALDQPEEIPAKEEGGDIWDTWLARWNRGPGRRHWKYDRGTPARWNFRRDVRAAVDSLRYTGWQLPR